MKVLRRSRRLVWAGGCAALALGMAGAADAVSAPAQARVTQVAARGACSLALRSDGTVWAWGDNRAGQLGRGTTSNHEVTPARVTGLAGVTKISAGNDFSLALCSDGTVSAWGDNRRGQ